MTQSGVEDSGKAFIGISLDSKAFTRPWVRFALGDLVRRYSSTLILLADELLLYTRTARSNCGQVVLDLAAAEKFELSRVREVARFIESEVGRLDSDSRARITLKTWSDYSDWKYSRLLRRIRIAYETIPMFHARVVEVAEIHAQSGLRSLAIPKVAETSTAYIVDEIAMCLRVTELEGHCDEYHPSPDIEVLTDLYNGRFAGCGLTVRALIGEEPRRRFQVIMPTLI